jgi:hypothetical protein
MRFAIQGAGGAVLLEMPRDTGLAFLEWLGLGRPEFGAVSARALAPLCRRRLWPMPRNDHPTFRGVAADLLSIAESALRSATSEDVHVLFG